MRKKSGVKIRVYDDLDYLQDELKRIEKNQVELLLQLKRHKEQNACFYFKPHPKQEPIFDAIADDPNLRVVLMQGGNRSGKTSWLILQIISFLLGRQPWKGGKKMRFEPPVKVRLAGEDWTHHIDKVLVKKLWEWMPQDELRRRPRKNTQGVDYFWTLKNGSTLELVSYAQETAQLEGWNGHVVAFDEPPPRDKFIACKRGMVDEGGIILLSLTPLKEAWIYDEITTSTNPAYRTFYCDIKENPYLSKEEIKEFEESLTDEEKQVRARGQWLHLTGLIYKDFNADIHIIEPFKPPQNYTVYVAIDIHGRLPQAVTFLAVNEKELYFIFKEIWAHGDPGEVANWIINFHQHTHPVYEVIIDPSSKGDSQRGESTYSIIDTMMAQNGINFGIASKDKISGILKVKEALRSFNKLPSLFVTNDCKRTIWEFQRYVWDDWTNRTKTDDRQKPVDRDDHFMENIYRLLLIPPRYIRARYFTELIAQANMGYTPLDETAGY